MNVAALSSPQQVACTTNFEVPHSNAESRPQLRSLQDGLNSLFRRLSNATASGHQEIGVGPVLAPAHPSSELVKLGESKTVGPVNNQRVNVRHVQARLDNGGADQHIGLSIGESQHYLFQLGLGHLPVT